MYYVFKGLVLLTEFVLFLYCGALPLYRNIGLRFRPHPLFYAKQCDWFKREGSPQSCLRAQVFGTSVKMPPRPSCGLVLDPPPKK